MSKAARVADHPVHELFLARWSPHELTGDPLPLDELLSMLEAARWAPSADNAQPWRFVYARPGGALWAPLQALLRPVNQAWADRASALVLLLSSTGHQGRNNHAHAFDAGAGGAPPGRAGAGRGGGGAAMGGVG
ncbi:MAG: nitroreductase family protein, partial [Burkholderiaceae bacterium]